MVEENIDDDACEATPMGRKKQPGFMKHGMVVGEAVEVSMHHDSCDDRRGERFEEAVWSALLEVAKEVAQT